MEPSWGTEIGLRGERRAWICPFEHSWGPDRFHLRSSSRWALQDRLADREQVALAVSEPSGSLADALARIVVVDLREPVDRPHPWQVVLLEHHASGPEVRYGRLDVVDLPGHLGVRLGWSAVRLEQRELATRTAVEQTARPLLARLEAELVGIKRSRPWQILRR